MAKPLDHFSFSQYDLYQTCPRKYYHYYIDQIQPASQSMDAANFGKVVHKALEVLWLSKGIIKESYEVGVKCHDVLFPSSHAKYTRDLLYLCLAAYLKSYTHQIATSRVIATEKTLKFKISDVPVVIIIDLILENEEGKIVPYDFKTKSQTPSDMSMSTQADFYIYGIKEVLNLTPDHLIFDCITTTKAPKTQRFPAYRSAYQLDQWLAEVTHALENIKAYIAASDAILPRNQTSCYKWFRICEFEPLCSAGDKKSFDFMKTNQYIPKEPKS